MSILDKKHILTIDLDDSSIEYSKKIFFYNTDKNTSNLYVKIKKNNDDGVGVELSANDLKDITIKLTAIKPKTNQTRDMIGILTEELTDQSCAIYKFELLQEFTDQVGSVVCEFELSNASGEKVTIDAFSYRIKESKLTGLNAEIESNPDLPVLKQLIKEVKETAQTVNNIDNTNVSDIKTYSNKKIEEKFSTVSTQINTIAKEKADKSTTANIQQQVNNLVLGAVGDGNNAEVVQARGEYATLNDRLDSMNNGEKIEKIKVGELPYITIKENTILKCAEDVSFSIGGNNLIENLESLNVSSQNTIIDNNLIAEYTNNYSVKLTGNTDNLLGNNHYKVYNLLPLIQKGKTYTISTTCSEKCYVIINGLGEPLSKAGQGVNNRTFITFTIGDTLPSSLSLKLYYWVDKQKGTYVTFDNLMLCEGENTVFSTSPTNIDLLANVYKTISLDIGTTIPAVDGKVIEVYEIQTISDGGLTEEQLVQISQNTTRIQINENNISELQSSVETIQNSLGTSSDVNVFLGDSIPCFDSNTGGIGSIVDYMQSLCGGAWHNFAIGGTTMSSYRVSGNGYEYFTLDEWVDSIVSNNFTNQENGIIAGAQAGSTSYSITNKVNDAKALDWSKVDRIFLAFGTNDLAYKVSEVGTANDTVQKNGTMCESLLYAIQKLSETYPKIEIIVCGIIFRWADQVSNDAIISTNKIIQSLCEKYGIKYANLFSNMGVNIYNRTNFLYDGTHPNANGKERYANILKQLVM